MHACATSVSEHQFERLQTSCKVAESCCLSSIAERMFVVVCSRSFDIESRSLFAHACCLTYNVDDRICGMGCLVGRSVSRVVLSLLMHVASHTMSIIVFAAWAVRDYSLPHFERLAPCMHVPLLCLSIKPRGYERAASLQPHIVSYLML